MTLPFLHVTVSDKHKSAPLLRHRIEYSALRGVIGALHAVSWRTACAFGEWLGGLGYWPLGIRRHVVERQIAAAFPELDVRGVKELSRRSFRHLGRSTIEAALLPSMEKDEILALVEETSGYELVEEALAQGRGVIFITGHFGNWELGGAYMAARGVPIDVIVRGQSNPLFDGYINRTRQAIGMTVVRDHEAVRRTPRSLRDGRVVAFVADQGVLGLASTFVPFFGRPAKTPRGPAVFSIRYDVPTLFLVAVRQPSGRYKVSAERVDIERTGDRDRDVDAVVASYTASLERWVRTAPEQYFWQHRRWRRQPPDTPESLRDPTR